MDNWSKIANFISKRDQKAPRDPLGPLRIIKIIFSSCQDMKTSCQEKEFLSFLPQKKSYYVHITLWRPFWIFIKKKGDHIVFEIELYSKSFLNMFLCTCAKRHTSFTKTAYHVLFRHTPVPLICGISTKIFVVSFVTSPAPIQIFLSNVIYRNEELTINFSK